MREMRERITAMVAVRGRRKTDARPGKRPEGENDHCSGDERIESWRTERESSEEERRGR